MGDQTVRKTPMRPSSSTLRRAISISCLASIVVHVKAAADIECAPDALVDAVDKLGWTSLHFCGESGDLQSAKKLIARGAKVDAVSSRHKRTPLDRAALHGFVDL